MDASGIEFFYVSQPRKHDAGIITVGNVVNPLMIVPPFAQQYNIVSKCPARCTSQVCLFIALAVQWRL